MADTTLEASANSSQDFTVFGFWTFWYGPSIAELVQTDANNDLSFRRTTDAWATVGASSVVAAETDVALACWYEPETTGRESPIVHTFRWEDAGNTVKYLPRNLQTGTSGTASTVVSSKDAGGNGTAHMACAQARSGRLYVWGIGATSFAFYSDDGTNWVSCANPFETANDMAFGCACYTDDTNDIAVIYGDDSATEYSAKVYDASTDTWFEKAIGTGTVLVAGVLTTFGCAEALWDHSTFVAWNNGVNAATADLKTAKVSITAASVAGITVTAKTDVYTDTNGAANAMPVCMPLSKRVRVYYMRGTFDSNMHVYYKESSDLGATWGSEVQYSEVSDDYRVIGPNKINPQVGGRAEPAWYDDDDDDIFINRNSANDNDVATAAQNAALRIPSVPSEPTVASVGSSF